MPLKIAVAVQGRFHAFDVCRELLRRGHDVTLFTNYPAGVAERFGVPRARVRSFLGHGLAVRLLSRILPTRLSAGPLGRVENATFGRWAAREVLRDDWDVVVAFSGVAEDLFVGLGDRPTLKVLERGSAHIRTQRQILEEEQRRVGRWVEKPSDWIVAREEREYALADAIHLLSSFAERSFLEHGVEPGKLYRLRLGVQTDTFRPPAEVVEERCRRVRNFCPLRVLNVGTFSCRKGARDFEAVVRALAGEPFTFRCVGPVASDARPLARSLAGAVTFTGTRPQSQLFLEYQWGDLFLLPTVEDGFAMVLTQALAAGLPLLTTTNCAGPDLIRAGEQGWIVPIRSPEAIVERLRWCNQHREEVVRAARLVYDTSWSFDWQATAEQAERNFETALQRKRMSRGPNWKPQRANSSA
jgi:glycosyltransferase involved in cell wall biosynthesis